MPSYSYYAEKKLVYIAIAALSGYYPSFYTKCIKLNMQLFYNVRSISNTKYTRFVTLYRRLVPC